MKNNVLLTSELPWEITKKRGIAFNWPIAREKTDLISLRPTAFVTICYAVWFKTNSDFIKKKLALKYREKTFFKKHILRNL